MRKNKTKYSLPMDPEALMLTEHMQRIAGDNCLFERQGYKVVIEGRNTPHEVKVSKMPDEKVDTVIEAMSSALYEKFNRSVTRVGDKLFVSEPYSA